MPTKNTQAINVKTVAALTTAYSGWSSDWVELGAAGFGRLLFTIVKDDATSIEVRFLIDDSSIATGYRTYVFNGGSLAPEEATIDTTDLAATDNIAVDLDIRSNRKLKVELKKTGGAGTTTVAATLLLHNSR